MMSYVVIDRTVCSGSECWRGGLLDIVLRFVVRDRWSGAILSVDDRETEDFVIASYDLDHLAQNRSWGIFRDSHVDLFEVC